MQDSRFTDIKELVSATIRIYTGEARLSKNFEGQCRYDHTINKVGCAIGCHYTHEEAAEIEELAGGKPIVGLVSVPEARAIVDSRIDIKAVGLENLICLQRSHDWAKTPEAFINSLNLFLEKGEWATNLLLRDPARLKQAEAELES